MNIGFIGLGNMGSHMARHLIDAGHQLTVNDINEAATAPHRELGAAYAGTPKDVASASEVVFTSLPGPAEVEQVALGADGLIEGLTRGAVYVDLSTGSPTRIREVGAKIEAAGAHFLDAPVSGGVVGAEAGTLAVMVGGDAEVFERVRPLLEAIGGSVVHVGGVGSGTVAKLVHNAISMSTRIAVEECMTLAVKGGVDPEVMNNILLDASFGKQNLLKNQIPEIVLKGDFERPRFALGLAHKDVSLALELGKELGVPMAMAELTLAEMQRAIDRGWATHDNLVTFRLAEERAGVEVRKQT